MEFDMVEAPENKIQVPPEKMSCLPLMQNTFTRWNRSNKSKRVRRNLSKIA